MSYSFVPVNGFTPNNPGWSSIGNIDRWSTDAAGRAFTFFFGARSLVLTVLGPQAYRLRFDPALNADYGWETSIAVVNRDLGTAGLRVAVDQTQAGQLALDTGAMRIQIGLTPFAVAVYRGNQLIHRDAPGQGALYIPGAEVVAVMKTAAPGAFYVGCGEKAGAQLFKNNFTFTFFNYDNYTYNTGPCLGSGGPLNPTEPLYCSIPLLIEANPFPSGDFAGAAYACGIFLDNTAQSFINVTANDYSDMSGKYYLGALYNELDYYFFAGDAVGDVLAQYTALTGRAPMPPRYALGFHQGAYGYYDYNRLLAAAAAYRNARIPCDGLHIDVDFQDDYRTFTHSEIKFPECAQLFATLHQQGFKMSTNITPILTDNDQNETGVVAAYVQRQAIDAVGGLIRGDYADGAPPVSPYEGGVNYGMNYGNNPYKDAYPPLIPNRNNQIPLLAPGNYPDLGLSAVRDVWGQQYRHLLDDLGLDMIWQDMTCPAIDPNARSEYKTFPGALLMAREAIDTVTGTVRADRLPNAKLHNAYVLNLLRATAAGIDALRPKTRNFIIARGGYAGMQRYAGLWTGDSASGWDFLRINLPEVLNLGMSGVPISGCDIGGFAKGPASVGDTALVGQPFYNAYIAGGITNYELLTRWMQLGSFLPWFRNHYDGYNKGFQEPYAYGEPVPTNCRRYVELRYRMMQVYYDAMYECTQTGMPLARALFLNDPYDPGVYSHSDDQFFVGRDFLVAPMLGQYETASPPVSPVRGVYLPAGSDWYAFMDNATPLSGAVAGGTYIGDYYADLTRVPIYVRAGAILPFCELEQWVGQLPANPLTFNCYPGPDRWTDALAYQLYQDDGISADVRSAGNYRLSRIYQRTLSEPPHLDGVVRQVRVVRTEGGYRPAADFFFVAILGSVTKPALVARDGVTLPAEAASLVIGPGITFPPGSELPDVGNPANLAASPTDAWYWNASLQIAFAKIFDTVPDTILSFAYGDLENRYRVLRLPEDLRPPAATFTLTS